MTPIHTNENITTLVRQQNFPFTEHSPRKLKGRNVYTFEFRNRTDKDIQDAVAFILNIHQQTNQYIPTFNPAALEDKLRQESSDRYYLIFNAFTMVHVHG